MASVDYEKRVVQELETDKTYFSLKLSPEGIPLEPQPTNDPTDPLNWSWYWKHAILAQVAFASMMGPYTAAGIIPGFGLMAEEFHRSMNSISYQVGIHVLGLAFGNLLWTPLGNAYGRRPVYIISMFMSLVANIGGSRAPTYGTLMIARFLQGFGCDAANATGASTIADLFFLHERGAKTGLWTYPTTIGPYVGPLVGGFLMQAKGGTVPDSLLPQVLLIPVAGWRWALYLMAIINGFELFLMIFFLPETLFVRKRALRTAKFEAVQDSSFARQHPIRYNLTRVPWKRIGNSLTPVEFLRPFQMLRYPSVALLVLPYTIGVAYADVGLTNLIPSVFMPLYGFDAAQQGLSFIGFLVGCLVGESLAGKLSDIIVAWRVKRNDGVFEPEMRLCVLPLGFVLLPLGLLLWGIFVDIPTPWVGPVFAGGMAICGLQMIITIGTAYLIDCYRPQASISSTTLFFCRQIFAFTIPFYNYPAALSLGFTPWFGIQFTLTVLSCLPALLLYKYGKGWRERYGTPTFSEEL